MTTRCVVLFATAGWPTSLAQFQAILWGLNYSCPNGIFAGSAATNPEQDGGPGGTCFWQSSATGPRCPLTDTAGIAQRFCPCASVPPPLPPPASPGGGGGGSNKCADYAVSGTSASATSATDPICSMYVCAGQSVQVGTTNVPGALCSGAHFTGHRSGGQTQWQA